MVLVVIADALFFTHRHQFSELCAYLFVAGGHSVLDRCGSDGVSGAGESVSGRLTSLDVAADVIP